MDRHREQRQKGSIGCGLAQTFRDRPQGPHHTAGGTGLARNGPDLKNDQDDADPA